MCSSVARIQKTHTIQNIIDTVLIILRTLTKLLIVGLRGNENQVSHKLWLAVNIKKVNIKNSDLDVNN